MRLQFNFVSEGFLGSAINIKREGFNGTTISTSDLVSHTHAFHVRNLGNRGGTKVASESVTSVSGTVKLSGHPELAALAEFSDRVLQAGMQIKTLNLTSDGIEKLNTTYEEGGDAWTNFLDEHAPLPSSPE